MLGALEHQVLEQVRQPGPAGRFVLRPDVVPEVHRHQRLVSILMDDDVETVGESVVSVWNQLTGVRGMALRA
jgi:hypothetical protein